MISSPLVLVGMCRSGLSLPTVLLNPSLYWHETFEVKQRQILDDLTLLAVKENWVKGQGRLGAEYADAQKEVALQGIEIWGWRCSSRVWMLDLWDAILERSGRYVLLYRYPWDIAASWQNLGVDEFLRTPERAYDEWVPYHRAMFDFYHKYSSRCLLVNAAALYKDPAKFVNACTEKFDMQLSAKSAININQLSPSEFTVTDGEQPLIDLTLAVLPQPHMVLKALEESADVSGKGQWIVHPFSTRFTYTQQPINFSIVITCYNLGQFLIEAVASVENFAPPNCEVIIVNDGSTDSRTLEVLSYLKGAGYHILDQTNLGLAHARNAGVALAQGEFVLLLDADDRLRPGFIQAALGLLQMMPDVGVVYGDRYEFGWRQGVVALDDFVWAHILQENYIASFAVMRKQVWRDCGGFDPKILIVDDWEFWLNAAKHGWLFYHIPAPAFDYRKRRNSMSDPSSVTPLIAQQVWQHLTGKHADLFTAQAKNELASLPQMSIFSLHEQRWQVAYQKLAAELTETQRLLVKQSAYLERVRSLKIWRLMSLYWLILYKLRIWLRCWVKEG